VKDYGSQIRNRNLSTNFLSDGASDWALHGVWPRLCPSKPPGHQICHVSLWRHIFSPPDRNQCQISRFGSDAYRSPTSSSIGMRRSFVGSARRLLLIDILPRNYANFFLAAPGKSEFDGFRENISAHFPVPRASVPQVVRNPRHYQPNYTLSHLIGVPQMDV